METALNYFGLAATTNRQLDHGMTVATAVGIATGCAAHTPQADKWKTIESALLNAGMPVLVPGAAKADAVPIISYTIGGEIMGQNIHDRFIKPLSKLV